MATAFTDSDTGKRQGSEGRDVICSYVEFVQTEQKTHLEKQQSAVSWIHTGANANLTFSEKEYETIGLYKYRYMKLSESGQPT